MGKALHVFTSATREIIDSDTVIGNGQGTDNLWWIAIQAKAISLAHQEVGIARSIIQKEIVQICIATRKRLTGGENVLCQFKECALLNQERHICTFVYYNIPALLKNRGRFSMIRFLQEIFCETLKKMYLCALDINTYNNAKKVSANQGLGGSSDHFLKWEYLPFGQFVTTQQMKCKYFFVFAVPKFGCL